MSKTSTRISVIFTVALATVTGSVTSHAQTAVEPLGQAPVSGVQLPIVPTATVSPSMGDVEAKNPNVAFGLSILSTIAGYGVFVGGIVQDNDALALGGLLGIVVGPSAGHIYTGEYLRGGLASGVRAVGVVAMTVGASLAFSCFYDEECTGSDNGPLWAWSGLGLITAGTIYSVVDSFSSADRVNARRGAMLTIAPTPIMGPLQSRGMGLSLSGSF